MAANERWDLTLTLLTWRIWWAPNNARKWQMGFKSAFNGLILVGMRSTSDKICTGTQNTCFVFSYCSYCNSYCSYCNSYCSNCFPPRTGHRWQHNTTHAPFTIDNWCYKHTLRACNSYCFTTATMVTRTRLNVTCTLFVLLRSQMLLTADVSNRFDLQVFGGSRQSAVDTWYVECWVLNTDSTTLI